MASELVPVDDDHWNALSDRQRFFFFAYVGECRGNATEAARAAGYADASYASLCVQGSRLLSNANMRACIDRYMNAVSMSTAEITAELTSIAKAPMDRFQQMVNEYISADGKHVQQIIRQDLNPKVNALKELAQIRGLHAQQIDINIQHTRTIVGVNISDVTGRHREIEGTAREVTDTTEQEQEQEQEQDS